MGCFATPQVLSAYEKQFSVAKAVSGKEGGGIPRNLNRGVSPEHENQLFLLLST